MVYVDDMNAPFRNMVMCHMTAENAAELDEFAKKIGLKTEWRQSGSWAHYDVSLSKKKQAIDAGATAVTTREMVKLVRQWRQNRMS